MTKPVKVLTAGGAASAPKKAPAGSSTSSNNADSTSGKATKRRRRRGKAKDDSKPKAKTELSQDAKQQQPEPARLLPKERQNPTPPPVLQEDNDHVLVDLQETGQHQENNDNGAPPSYPSREPILVAGGPHVVWKSTDDDDDDDDENDDAKLLEPTHIVSTTTTTDSSPPKSVELLWLLFCFLGIMMSFVCYGLLLEYTTSGGRQLHELSFLFVTSALYTVTAAFGRHVRDETPTSIPPARFAVLGLTSMGSTFCSVRSLRYVIYPIQVLAKSCKPVPVMIMGAFMGKKYPLRKYVNVCLIVMGVALFMGGGDNTKKQKADDSGGSSASQFVGILLLFVSLCFDGGTGAYEDKLMSVHSVGPFDLMYNIQLGKTILAGIGLIVLNQVHIFWQMCQEMGLLLVALGLSGAIGQVFIFVTIAKFGALTCSIIGLARKVTTLVASIYFYGHSLNGIQFTGLVISVGSMVMNFWGKKGGGGHGPPARRPSPPPSSEEMEKMLAYHDDTAAEEERRLGQGGDVELSHVSKNDKTVATV